ncbi:hypothetical protein DFH07DRAFT_775622 [Mycena maculata]|uniref:Uncharacterized protein n=1 Tax=Mycena maculata TaxID=230809 RepID=A0AAD7IU00_9AGAR|nr:hypothetical protein DFH07DRAFT_775622 [Mycena maculata]
MLNILFACLSAPSLISFSRHPSLSATVEDGVGARSYGLGMDTDGDHSLVKRRLRTKRKGSNVPCTQINARPWSGQAAVQSGCATAVVGDFELLWAPGEESRGQLGYNVDKLKPHHLGNPSLAKRLWILL